MKLNNLTQNQTGHEAADLDAKKPVCVCFLNSLKKPVCDARMVVAGCDQADGGQNNACLTPRCS